MLNGEAEKNSHHQSSTENGDEPDWDVVEANWKKQVDISRSEEDARLQQEYGQEAAAIHAELVEAVAQHTRLSEALLQAGVLVDEKHADLDWLEDQFEKRKRSVAEKRAADDLRVQTWINNGRAAIRGSARTPDQSVTENWDIVGSRQMNNGMHSRRVSRNQDATMGDFASPMPMLQRQMSQSELYTLAGEEQGEIRDGYDASHSIVHYSSRKPEGVEVVNPDGDAVGILKRVGPENHWIEKLLDLPIRRSVEIRMGRKLTQTHLDEIYRSKEPKKTKWLSFMIQATGELQGRACHACAKGQGLYSLCIIVGGSDFPRCGNCEWNKQGCHGAAAQSSSLSKRSKQPASTYQQQHIQISNPLVVSISPSAEKTTEINTAQISMDAKEHSRRSRTKDKPAAIDTNGSEKDIPHLSSKLEEITKETLELKDDGMIYLEPEIMRGVPLRKISPEHAYWERDWKRIEIPIRTKLDEWVEKLATLKSMSEHSQTEKDRTSVFQAGRQVNRGKSSLKFLLKGDFHPFQIIGKQWITPSLAHYDTLFRMVTTLEELAKFKMDVTPLQWLRQRLHEIYTERPAGFKLDRVIAEMYHDPKLADLRLKNGFGNIGRPSAGARVAGEKRKEAPTTSTAATSTPIKRVYTKPGFKSSKSLKRNSRQRRHGQKRQRTSSPTPETSDQESSKEKKQTAHQNQTTSKESDSISLIPGILVYDSASSTQAHQDDLDHIGYTSTDSLTKDPVVKKDWRVHQVKTMRLTSNPSTTQYWHWVDKCHDCEPMFEHQVLKEMEPSTSWGIFKEPIDFHLRLRELTNIVYSQESGKIIIGTRQVEGVEWRGNVLADFKRERTKRRFLTFMCKKGIDLVRTQGDVIEGMWDRMQSEVMAGGDSE